MQYGLATHQAPTSIGGRNQLLAMQNPALRPQPESQNWGFHTQLPPVLAARITGMPIRGTGMYMGTRGRGLYM